VCADLLAGDGRLEGEVGVLLQLAVQPLHLRIAATSPRQPRHHNSRRPDVVGAREGGGGGGGKTPG
jgi:hypothetical protein